MIPNGNTVYPVFWRAPKNPDAGISAGVNVEIGGNLAVTVECNAGSVVRNIEGRDLRPTDR